MRNLSTASLKLGAVLAVVALAACAPQVESRIFLSQVAAAVAGRGPVAAPTVLRVPEGSRESCFETLASRQKALAILMPVPAKGQCVEIEGEAFAEIPTLMPILLSGAVPPPDHLIVLEVEPSLDDLGQSYTLSVRLMRSMDDVAGVLTSGSDGMTLSPELEDPKFTFRIENDSGGPALLTAWFAYIGGVPGLPGAGEPVPIGEGESVDLVLSDVVSSYLAAANAYRIAVISLNPVTDL